MLFQNRTLRDACESSPKSGEGEGCLLKGGVSLQQGCSAIMRLHLQGSDMNSRRNSCFRMFCAKAFASGILLTNSSLQGLR
ncbi:hypothetical protein F3P66_15770 [Agrobacterium fabrum]|uniref:Uncharacterized protein n=1 Tax=Agrobacterium fabrum (strain C58 / ATCC 33970) TaxID=176299 RepID=Q8UAW7_AGRFC|nr:hypothetical protein Atu3250 [Agrobacterium fabrum str. C58]QRM60937.1 hypothetical protein F3P66_15770 [Agrobacterium fabrum]TRB29846.1 hypothetical protein EXN51_08595 [Agrobacterium fabrum]